MKTMNTILFLIVALVASATAMACGDDCKPASSGWGEFTIDSGTYAYGGGNAGDIQIANGGAYNIHAKYGDAAEFNLKGAWLGQNSNVDGQTYIEAGGGAWGNWNFSMDGDCLEGCNKK